METLRWNELWYALSIHGVPHVAAFRPGSHRSSMLSPYNGKNLWQSVNDKVWGCFFKGGSSSYVVFKVADRAVCLLESVALIPCNRICSCLAFSEWSLHFCLLCNSCCQADAVFVDEVQISWAASSNAFKFMTLVIFSLLPLLVVKTVRECSYLGWSGGMLS